MQACADAGTYPDTRAAWLAECFLGDAREWLAARTAELSAMVTPMAVRLCLAGPPSTHRMQTRQGARAAEVRARLFEEDSGDVGVPGLVGGLR